MSRPLGAILVLSVSCVVGACHGSRSPATGAADACAFCDADAGSSVCPAACRSALSDDCDSVVGPYRDANAITIGALYSTEGPGAAIGLARRQSASLAVEQIDSAGGVPIANGRARPLAMIACDESRDLLRASRHLVSDLGVSAIIGPDTTQDMLDLARKLTIASGTLLMSPSALAASISDLVDQDLAWTMVPHDSDRAALMVDQVGAIERALHAQRGSGPLKLGIVFRNDALGQSTRVSLDQLSFNGAGLTDPINLNDHVRVDPYEPDAPEQSALVASYLDFSPDVIVLIGETESVSQIMAPLETSWPSDKPKPEYLVTDASKVPELLTLASRVSDLSARLRGIGVTFTDDARAAHQLFVSDYQMRRPGIDPTLSGVASSRDAVIAIGAALAANPVAVPVGSDVAAGLRTLSIGGDAIDAASPDLMARLARGDHLSAIGSEGALQWDATGSIAGGELEVWCISPGATASFASSGLRFDVAVQRTSGAYVGCAGGQSAAMPDAGATSGGAGSLPSIDGGPGDAGGPNAPSSAGSAADGGAGRSAKDPDAADGGGAVNAADGGGALIDHGVTAQYYAGSDKQSDDVIYPILQISNVSVAAGVPLYELEIRYYFHNEHEDRCPVNCQVDSFWAGEHPSGKSLTAVRRWVSGSDGADYLSVTFPATLEVLARGAAVEMQQQLHTAPFSQFDQSDDYSFDATKHALTDWPKVTVYRAGSLVWGTPP